MKLLIVLMVPTISENDPKISEDSFLFMPLSGNERCHCKKRLHLICVITADVKKKNGQFIALPRRKVVTDAK